MATYFKQQEPGIRIYDLNVVASGTTNTLTYNVPADRILVLYGFSASWVSGSLSTVTLAVTCDGFDIYRETTPGGVNNLSRNQTKQVFCRGGSTVTIQFSNTLGGSFTNVIRGQLIGNNL